MIFAELPLAQAEGALLAHSILLGGRRVAKGSPVDAELLAAARAAGIERLWAARLEPGDVPEAEAAAGLGARLAGPGVAARPPVHGRVDLVATIPGLLAFESRAVDALNGAGEAAGLATLPPHVPVAAGDLVATLKIMPYAVPAGEMAALLAAARPLSVAGWRPGLSARLLQTQGCDGDASGKAADKTARVTGARLARLGVAMARPAPVAHAVTPLAAALRQANEPLVLVAGAAATSDRRDVVPAAIEAAGGELVRVGLPVDPGNLLVLGRLGDRIVIGLPGCARSPKRNGLDLVLERWAAGLPLDSARLAGLGVGGLLEGGGAAVPWGGAG
ncbi:MAG: molybdopterin-binding protein [Sphingomonadaceae bacterium]